MSQFPTDPPQRPLPPDEGHFTPYPPDDGRGWQSPDEHPHAILQPRQAFTVFAWIVIIVLAGFMAYMYNAPVAPAAVSDDNSLAEAMMELQAKLLVGAHDLQPGNPTPMSQLEPLNIGPVSQRDRFIILVSELAGPAAADEQLQILDQLIAEEQAARQAAGSQQAVMTPNIERAHGLVRQLYAGAAADPDGFDLLARIDGLSTADRDFLEAEYGWFGQLAVLPRGTPDKRARDQLLAGHGAKAILVGAGVIVLIGVGLLGLVGLIIMTILTLAGRLRSGIERTSVHTGVYAETFAVWFIFFFALQMAVGATGAAMQVSMTMQMAATFACFFISLAALAWPVLRGVPWRDVRRDIGWTAGRQPVLEPLIGLGGYAAGLPILAVGFLLTFLLMLLAGMVAGPASESLSPAGGPAHPIVGELTSAGLPLKLVILALATIAAPIVEETMFRGVLYRHLRASSRTLGIVGAIVMGTVVNAFIFAIVHPQGWIAVPALMSLAVTFTLLREWRGTVIPSMIVHGTSNGLVIGTLLLLL